MKVLHIIAGPLTGGAARSVIMLHKELLAQGVESVVLNNSFIGKHVKIPEVFSIYSNPLSLLISKVKNAWTNMTISIKYPYRQNRPFSVSSNNMNLKDNYYARRASIIHLHWTSGMLNVEELASINKTLIWSLRDWWPLTGGCHYPIECTKYLSQCNTCPQLASKSYADLSYNEYLKKTKNFRNIMTVSVSRDASNKVKESPVIKGNRHTIISNGIDCTQYRPYHYQKDHKYGHIFNDQSESTIITTANSFSSYYKGADLLMKALGYFKGLNIKIILVGNASRNLLAKIPIKYISLGYIDNFDDLSFLYTNSDVYAASSRMDSFPKAPLEAMACGTPVVCFESTGTTEIIECDLSGYVAEAENPKMFAQMLLKSINNKSERKLEVGKRCRSIILKKYSIERIANEYIQLYNTLSQELS